MTVRPQDLGGHRGFGPVPIEQDEPVFHSDWEASVIAGILATMRAGLYNLDQFREAIDELDPLSYLTLGYYRRWLHTLEVNCLRTGVFTDEELEARIQAIAAGAETPPGSNTAIAGQLHELIYTSGPEQRPMEAAPAFAVGDAVRGRVLEGARHARIPAYAQGRRGVVEQVHPAFPYPETSRLGQGERPEYVYGVRFESRELWPDADERSTVVVDLWETYLEPAEGAP